MFNLLVINIVVLLNPPSCMKAYLMLSPKMFVLSLLTSINIKMSEYVKLSVAFHLFQIQMYYLPAVIAHKGCTTLKVQIRKAAETELGDKTNGKSCFSFHSVAIICPLIAFLDHTISMLLHTVT